MTPKGKTDSMKHKLAFALIAQFVGQTYGVDALADCSTVTDSTTTCSSDNSSISFTDGTVTTITIDGLTSDIGGDTAIQLEQGAAVGSGQDADGNGNVGTDAAFLTVDGTFDDGFGVDADSIGIQMVSTGGAGAAGEDSDKAATEGGQGGVGGKLVVTLSGDATLSASELGLLLETTGGAGGNAGSAADYETVSVGGSGAVGGVGGDVSVTLSDGFTISVSGDSPESGIFVTSQGGDGGNGGDTGDGGSDVGSTGGVGAAGGNGGDIIVSASQSESSINTSGSVNHGVFAESLGGDGGTGGTADAGDAETNGGDGGAGGNGGNVEVDLYAKVTVTDEKSQGIYARSFGGAGGDGGKAEGAEKKKNGSGGGGGDGGTVTVTYEGIMGTGGSEANGILAQSVGGFIGDAKDTSGLIAWGTGDRSSGDGGAVTVSLTSAKVTTSQTTSSGIEAQSVGGGGGKGSSDADSFDLLGTTSSEAGGNGGTVDVELTDSSIFTISELSPGIAASSIGGGGGSGGSENSVTSVGSTAGSGGTGGNLTLTLDSSTVSTKGLYSTGIYASTVGGGGGNAYSTTGITQTGGNGGDGGAGGTIIVTLKGSGGKVTTEQDLSDGIFLQSVGGGGGNGANSVSISTTFEHTVGGGSGGAGGNAGTVTYTDTGETIIQTSGAHARGLVAQSIGGGGGHAGNDLTVETSFGLSINVGGEAKSSGGDGSDGDTVSVTQSGSVSTTGDLSTGILAHSIGGSGGSGGTTIMVQTDIADIDSSHSHNIGSSGGDGGIGGAVEVDVSGTVSTSGVSSDAILAQSVGGSGGVGGTLYDFDVSSPASLSFAGSKTIDHNVGSGGAGGDAGTVSVTVSDDVTTLGAVSNGIVAQSIAGGGGNGGTTISLTTLSVSTLNTTVGSNGGKGGTADIVNVVNSGSVNTTGHQSSGILAQSVGGSGGNAGTVVASNDFDASLNFTMGGAGGNGSASGDVIVVNAGTITTASGTDVTTGDNSAAIIAQSIGGGGGNGGKVIDADVSTGTFQASFGGSGAKAGSSGNVFVTNSADATLQTSGTYAYGILAQSVAGDGGNGGNVVNVAADAGEISGAVTFTLGGKGGTGGASQEVNVTNGGMITTSGFAAMGVVAQTIGGDGGSGGTVVSGAASLSSEASIDVQYSFGGEGGGGGQAGEALIVNSGQITTGSHFADALYAQSIGGNGGMGGSSYAALVTVTKEDNIGATVSVGGGGGDGGLAGDVTIINSGTIQTDGGNSNGIYAQSVGGNGGDGGSGVAMLANFGATSSQSMSASATATVGGGGGSGNDAGSVFVNNAGSVTTTNDVARGIFAQSVGGGGGDGGSAAQYSLGYTEEAEDEGDDSSSFSFSLTVGGNGGGGGTGDTVTVENSGELNTQGVAAYGIFAQSVGGSGGNGGDGQLKLSGWVADVADITLALSEAQSVYDNLSDPSSVFENYQIDIGGNGGASSDGGEVDVSSTNTITTQGKDATAIFAQSVGGGGGSGGDGSQGVAFSVTAGGFGSKGGTGGAVTVSSSDTIQTNGDRAMGIFAQSVGGGGGAAGDVEAGLVSAFEDLTLGTDVVGDGKSGDGGDGGTVTVTADGDISTTSTLAHAIFAQSIGGGGGGEGRFDLDATGSMSNVEAALGSAGNKGNGDDVDVTVGGAITVKGEFAAGVFAQSVGGKDSTGGDVTVTVSGSIQATGTSGRAIVTHSEGGSGGGANKVIIAEGATVSSSLGSDGYDTVSMLNGSSIELTNSGTLENTSEDASSYVINAGGTTSTVTNDGTLTGSVDLSVDSSHGNLTNNGTFNMGSVVDLGLDENKLTNTGTLSPGGSGTITTSTVTAQDGLEMSSDGIYLVDVTLDDTSTADMVSVVTDGSGKADLGSGTVTPNVISSLPRSGETGSVDIMTVDVDDGIDNVDTTTVTDSASVDYTLSSSSDGSTTTLSLGYTVDYSGVGDTDLSQSSTDFALYYDSLVAEVPAAYDEDSDEYQTIVDLTTVILNTRTGEALDALYGEHVLNEAGASLLSARRAVLDLHDLLHSCPDLAHDPLAGFLGQQDCYWFNAQGGGFDQDRTAHNPGYDETWAGFSGGLQRQVADDLFVELAGMFDLYWLDGDNFDQDGYRVYGGAAVKREIGNHTLSATLSGGVFGYDYDRTYETKDGIQSASSDPFGGFFGGELRASSLFNHDRNYIKPSIGLAVFNVWQDSFIEQGDGGLEWQINSTSESYFALRPSVEVGRSLTINENPATLYARVGLTAFLNNPDVALSGELAGFNGLLPAHDVTLESDRYFGELEIGMDARLDEAMKLSITAQGSVSKNSWAAGGGLNLSRRF